MKLLSIDVGIKNLAYCLFDLNTVTNAYDILLWDVINLCGEAPNCENPNCKKKAKLMLAKPIHYFCPTHAKKSTYIIPTANLSLQKIKKMKLVDLQKVITNYNIPLPSPSPKKEEILKTVLSFMENKMLQSVTTVAANDFDLIKLGIAMRDAFNHDLVNHIATIDKIVIENQISPIANRMKTLQGMIAQYFIMHNKTKISFVSAANKLKGVSPLGDSPPHPLLNENIVATSYQKGGEGLAEPDVKPPNYAFRKKEGIRITLNLLNEKYIQWLPHFNQHKKKDDLADAFLQGIYVLNKSI
jgi:hypothetical protein